MISTAQILAAGAITGIAVAIAAAAVRWQLPSLSSAALSTFVLMVVWRRISNQFDFNGDFLPLVSIGDSACLGVGALGPAIIAASGRVRHPRRWVPAAVGGLIGFAVNVGIL